MGKRWKIAIAFALLLALTTVNASAATGIKSATFNQNKVVFKGAQLDLSAQPMISVVKEGETYFSNYMPVRAVLEGMGFHVEWDDANNTVVVSTGDWLKPEDLFMDGKTVREFFSGNYFNFDKIYGVDLIGWLRKALTDAGEDKISRLPDELMLAMFLDDYAAYLRGDDAAFGKIWNEMFE